MGWSWNSFKKSVEDVAQDVGKTVWKAGDDIDGTTAKNYAEDRNKKQQSERLSDKKKSEEFKSQDFLNPEADLYVPNYKRSPALRKEQEAMLSLFNARKDEILAGRATPGINQTRF